MNHVKIVIRDIYTFKGSTGSHDGKNTLASQAVPIESVGSVLSCSNMWCTRQNKKWSAVLLTRLSNQLVFKIAQQDCQGQGWPTSWSTMVDNQLVYNAVYQSGN